MRRAERDHLVKLLRNIHAELRAAPQDTHDRAKEYAAELGPNALIVGLEPFALGNLEARVSRIAAELDATIHVHLERRRRRPRA